MSKAFIDLRKKADNDTSGFSHRRTIQMDGTTYCFLCHGDSKNNKSREARKQQLSVFCHIARGQYPENKKVIGIATDQKIKSHTAYDFSLLDMPRWSKTDQEIMELNMRDTGILTNPK